MPRRQSSLTGGCFPLTQLDRQQASIRRFVVVTLLDLLGTEGCLHVRNQNLQRTC